MLQHPHDAPPRSAIIAIADVNLVLETTKRQDLEVGAWVNVIGYIQDSAEAAAREEPAQEAKIAIGSGLPEQRTCVPIQVIMLWNAGAIDLTEYEKAVTQRSGNK